MIVASRGPCRRTESKVESVLHVSLQIDRLVRCHMQVRIARMRDPRWMLRGAGLSWHYWHPTGPCCSDDCSTFTICDLTCATNPRSHSATYLSTALWLLGGVPHFLVRRYASLPSFRGPRRVAVEKVVRSLFASPPSTHAWSMGTMIRAGPSGTRLADTDGPPPSP